MSGTFQIKTKVNDEIFDETVTVASKQNIIVSLTAPKAKSGTLTTRTSGTVGVITLATGHGIIGGDKVGLYWAGGQCDADVTGDTSTTISITTIAGGDALPSAATVIIAGKIAESSIVMSTDDIKAFAIYAGGAGKVAIRSLSDPLLSRQFSAAGQYSWFTDSGITNPVTLSETTDKIQTSTSSTDSDRLMRLAILRD